MKLIEKLSDMIEEEICDADKYITCALNHKNDFDYPFLSEMFYKLSEEEMKHMAMLHESVTKIIEDYRKKNGAPPADMMAIYEYLHRKQMEKATEVKNKQAYYKTLM